MLPIVLAPSLVAQVMPFSVAQATSQATPAERVEILHPQEVRPLTGQLDTIPVFNSNSPEVVQTEGILLSTFPPTSKRTPSAHLNFAFNGRFDLFAHHIAKATAPNDLRTLYLGAIVHNPGNRPVRLSVLQGASYLSQPDAPFIEIADWIENPAGDVYAGPGSRITDDVLRGKRQDLWPPVIVIPAKTSHLLLNLAIPVKDLDPPINGRSTLLRLRSSGPVYVASLGQFARQTPDGNEIAPTLADWETLLKDGELAGPRHITPTPPEQTKNFRYGRVAGVAQGSQWQANLTDEPQAYYLTIPPAGEAFSYGISSLDFGTLGTKQVQSAPMLVRYRDTAYRAHGNYGIHYHLTLPLLNSTDRTQTVVLALQTPIKEDRLSKAGLRFFQPPERRIFFRGTVRVRYTDERGLLHNRYIHLVQQRGQQGKPLVTLNLRAGERRLVTVELLYPPDSTPPQVLTVRTLTAAE